MAALGSLVADYSDSESDSEPITLVFRLLMRLQVPCSRLLCSLDLDTPVSIQLKFAAR